jgi:hypothetical protein
MATLATRLVILFVFGAIYGSVLDALHTHAGVFRYTHEWLFRMATWTPLVFGGAGLSLGLLYPVARRLTGEWPARELTWTEMTLALNAFALIYAASAYIPASSLIKLTFLAVCGGAMFGWLAGTRLALLLAFGSAVVGPAIEGAFASLGQLTHRDADFIGLPMWLPALYFSGALTYGAFGQKVFGRAPSLTPSGSNAGSARS